MQAIKERAQVQFAVNAEVGGDAPAAPSQGRGQEVAAHGFGMPPLLAGGKAAPHRAMAAAQGLPLIADEQVSRRCR